MLTRKLKSAVTIFRTTGSAGVMAALRRQFNPAGELASEGVDEVGIVFGVLSKRFPKGTMVDVGAHFGHTAEPFCRLGWRVAAFEPDSENRAKLVDRLAPYPNVSIDRRAISNEEKPAVTFYRSGQSTGISGLSSFDPSHIAADTVPMTTLAVALHELAITHVDFLKIDTEGFDKFVLEGLPWDIIHPAVIICEFEDHKTKPLGYDFHTLAADLVSRGYKIIVSEWKPIVRYGVAHQWLRFQDYPCTLAEERSWGNLIAVADSTLNDAIHSACRRAAGSLH